MKPEYDKIMNCRFSFSLLNVFLLFILVIGDDHQLTFDMQHNRCRSFDDMKYLPIFQRSSTFHNFGFPLIRILCQKPDSVQSVLGCNLIQKPIYHNEPFQESRNGEFASEIVIIADQIIRGTTNPSQSVIHCQIYGQLHELGYLVHLFESSEICIRNNIISSEAKISAERDKSYWKKFISGSIKTPLTSQKKYLVLEISYSEEYSHDKFTSTLMENSIGILKWIIGSKSNAAVMTATASNINAITSSPMQHYRCIGANYFLAEYSSCTSSSIIMYPTLKTHLTQAKKENHLNKKQNMIIMDVQTASMFPVEYLKQSLIEAGVTDIEIIIIDDTSTSSSPPSSSSSSSSSSSLSPYENFYKLAKVSMSCANTGVDYLSMEATVYDVITLTCRQNTGNIIFDTPVPYNYHIQDITASSSPTSTSQKLSFKDTESWKFMINDVTHYLLNYSDHIDNFQVFHDLSLHSEYYSKKHLDLHLYSRDVVFRTYCQDASQCRCVFPWALSIWVLYPMARIEVYTPFHLTQFTTDNKVFFNLFPHLFQPKHFQLHLWKQDVASLIQQPSIYGYVPYLIYMSPHFILFGRDFINDHMYASKSQPIIRYSADDREQIVFIHYEAPSITFQYLIRKYTLENIPNLQLDMLFLPPQSSQESTQWSSFKKKGLGEVWLTSSTPRVDIQYFLRYQNYFYSNSLVRHLDPILQSNYYLKSKSYFPYFLQRLLLPFDTIFHPLVVSLRDAKYESWGEHCENKTALFLPQKVHKRKGHGYGKNRKSGRGKPMS